MTDYDPSRRGDFDPNTTIEAGIRAIQIELEELRLSAREAQYDRSLLVRDPTNRPICTIRTEEKTSPVLVERVISLNVPYANKKGLLDSINVNFSRTTRTKNAALRLFQMHQTPLQARNSRDHRPVLLNAWVRPGALPPGAGRLLYTVSRAFEIHGKYRSGQEVSVPANAFELVWDDVQEDCNRAGAPIGYRFAYSTSNDQGRFEVQAASVLPGADGSRIPGDLQHTKFAISAPNFLLQQRSDISATSYGMQPFVFYERQGYNHIEHPEAALPADLGLVRDTLAALVMQERSKLLH